MAAAAFKAAIAAIACAGCTAMQFSPGVLEGSHWRVTSINGHATPERGRFRMEFDRAGMVSARFGCNSGGGSYRIQRDRIVTRGIIQTQMACQSVLPTAIDPMTWERWGFAVLGRPMRMESQGKQRLLLRNEAGSILLERLP